MMNSDGGTKAEETLLRIHFLQAGSSDCILIECRPCSTQYSQLTKETPYKSMLIDGGMANNQINQVVHGYCTEHLGWENGRIFDYLLITHSHEDHLNGITTQKIKAKFIIDSGFHHEKNEYPRNPDAKFTEAADTIVASKYLDHISGLKEKKSWSVPPFCPKSSVEESESNTPQLNINEGKDISFHWLFAAGVLNTPTEIEKRRPVVSKMANASIEEGEEPKSPNLYSLGFILKWKDFLFYSGGDAYAELLEQSTFSRLFDVESAPKWMKDDSGNLLKIAVFKSSHHGSATSVPMRDDKYWLEMIQPDTVVTLTNFDFRNLPCEEFADSLLETTKAIANPKNKNPKAFAAYFLNHFDIFSSGKHIRQTTYNKLLELSQLQSNTELFSNLYFYEGEKRYKKLTNKIDSLPSEPESIENIKNKRKSEETLNADTKRKKEEKEQNHRKEFNEDDSKQQTPPKYTLSPLSLIIEVSKQSMSRQHSNEISTKIDEKFNYFLTRKRRLHDEILLYRQLDEEQLTRIASRGSHSTGFVITEIFSQVRLHFTKFASKKICVGKYPIKDESGLKIVDQKAYFDTADRNPKYSTERRILVDPFRRYLWLRIVTETNVALREMIFQRENGREIEKIKDTTRLHLEKTSEMLKLNTKNINGNLLNLSTGSSERERLNVAANELANSYIDYLWSDGKRNRDFKESKKGIKDTEQFKVMDNLVRHPFFGLVAGQFFCGCATSTKGTIPIVATDFQETFLDMDLAYRQSIGITDEVFNLDEFYNAGEARWGDE